MIYLPVSVLLFLILLLSLPFLILALTFDVVTVSAAKLGFAPGVAVVLLVLIFIGGVINIPLYRTESVVKEPTIELFHDFWGRQYWGFPQHEVRTTTIVALNVGGGLIPIMLALYQFTQAPFWSIMAVTAVVTVVSYYASQIVPGIGHPNQPAPPPHYGGYLRLAAGHSRCACGVCRWGVGDVNRSGFAAFTRIAFSGGDEYWGGGGF